MLRCCILVDCTRGLCKGDKMLVRFLTKVCSASFRRLQRVYFTQLVCYLLLHPVLPV